MVNQLAAEDLPEMQQKQAEQVERLPMEEHEQRLEVEEQQLVQAVDVERVPPDVFLVRDKSTAQQALKVLYSVGIRNRFHACDTEVMNIEVKKESPVGHGFVTALAIYCGPDVDFSGLGKKQSRLFVDNLGGAKGTLDLFKSYLEDPKIQKAFHNYSFDRHVLGNHEIHCKGFAADTMHMARLWDSAMTTFDGGQGYSLEGLSKKLLQKSKVSMKTRFSKVRVLKNGEEGKNTELPKVEVLQSEPETREDFIDYACFDAEATWLLREELQKKLSKQAWGHETLYQFYQKHYCPFGELLTDMEAKGIYVNKEHLRRAQTLCEADRDRKAAEFRDWAIKYCPEAVYMNIHSSAQKAQLFFAPCNYKNATILAPLREFKTDNVHDFIEEGKEKPKKYFEFKLHGIGGINGKAFEPIERTPSGVPSVNVNVLRKLAGYPRADPPKYGIAMERFKDNIEEGKAACLALDALCAVSATNIMLHTFIGPLQENTGPTGRIHFSLNINTETGRLSCRNPNLQNQPALEKDVYEVRRAFAAATGNSLIVADYGQLELRMLAHVSACTSMIEAFEAGGDFHSRTALAMYPKIQQAVKEKKVVLERKPGDPVDIPLLKDVFASERRKAKMLNFSIAYGKTERGLALDWGVSFEEARKTVQAWYSDRPEVKEWQADAIMKAHENGVTVPTIMGRHRPLPDINSADRRAVAHSERAAINTPIQGGAADVVMKAMLKLHQNERFRELGWQLVLQIHDEIIAEGPTEHVQEAMIILKQCMEKPFEQDLLVDLVVDVKHAQNWYEGK
eukprot:gb/GEZN01002199.1/.p1 GENE.gb/GEZN01002199.1/~~gb/GEZN01002199.1/.p1  ORF type:complete len:806 (+),score=177.31 gb/GEZN01002199.1/:46-2418(+)